MGAAASSTDGSLTIDLQEATVTRIDRKFLKETLLELDPRLEGAEEDECTGPL